MGMDELEKRVGGAAALEARIGFVVELSRRLHEYGTAAPRLEDVINLVSARLGLVCNVLSTPTSIVMSFSDRRRPGSLADVTQVVRLSPGEVNLERLCEVDEIADQVIDGVVDLVEGRRRLRDIGARPARWTTELPMMVAYGAASACVAIILRTGSSSESRYAFTVPTRSCSSANRQSAAYASSPSAMRWWMWRVFLV